MGLDLGKARENYQRKTEKGARPDRWKPTEGDNPIRVMPHDMLYFEDKVGGDIAYTYFCHFDVGPEGAKEWVVCPKTLNRKNRCPICEAVAQLIKTGDPGDAAMANSMGIRRRYLMNVIDLKNDQETAKGIQVLECGPTIHTEVLQWANVKWGDPLDFEAGRDLTLTMTLPDSKDMKKAKYSVAPDPDKTPIGNRLPANWKDQIRKLKTLVPEVKTYDEIKRILEGEMDYGEPSEGAEEVTKAEAGVTNTAPQPQQQTAPVAQPSSEPMKAPDCFGKSFSMRSEKCKACAFNATCKDTFLSQ